MIFESIWPLALLSAVPVVIILYLLRPRGKDYRISSNLLWEQLIRNQQSKTFLEKFIHNILMYLQILIILLLVLALMSPYLQRQGQSGGNVIFVFDTSGSMQHDAGNGRTRLEEAVEQAEAFIRASEETAFSVVMGDCLGTNLLAVGVKDKDSLLEVLRQIECSDGPGDLQGAESIVETLRSAGSQDAEGAPGEGTSGAEVIVFTDGNGAGEAGAGNAMNFAEYFDAQVLVMGGAVSNVANNFLSYVEEDGNAAEPEGGRLVRCASSITNYSDHEASMEISLYEGRRLAEVRQFTLGAGETRLCFFEEFAWQGEALRSEVGSVRFDGTDEEDSLAEDNTAYAVYDRAGQVEAVLVGEGNTYLEKAYQAVTGQSLTKVKGGDVTGRAMQDTSGRAGQNTAQTVYIYDAGEADGLQEDAGGLTFGDGRQMSGTAQRVLLTVTDCDLTAGLSSFTVGVNETKVYEVPDWGTGFLWAGDQCAGYYGEHDGVKVVAVGFDIRESDFPLKAEFPIFISNALHFLGDTSLLAENVYLAGDQVLFHPQADFDVGTLVAQTRKAGLYEVSAGDIAEQYVVRFAAGSQSDGRLTAEGSGADFSADASRGGLAKRQLRNVILALVLLLLAAEWVLYVRQTRYRGRFYLAVRGICAAMVLLALLGAAVSRRSGVNTTIFLVDLSNSNERNLQDMENYLENALHRMPGKNQYGIVTFGKDSMVDQFLTSEQRFSQIMSLPDKTATNFEEAMSRALAMIPADGAGRVVVLTDGRETRGNLVNTASALVSGQIELLARVYGTDQGQDAYVENVELPGYLYQGDAYSMTVTVQSSYETDAQIQIWMGSMQTDTYDVHLNRGANRFQFRQKVRGESVESFQVRVAAPGDTCEENNSYHAYSVVDSVPKVLLVSGLKEDSREFENLLRSANCNYSTVSAINAPSTLEQMLEFKSIILENVYLSDLPEGFLEQIETYVKDYGCGLVCCGGEESYALGGYRESVLETVLPVDMELRGVDEVPTTAMIMVIDHSGSMGSHAGGGATSLDLAITAAMTAVDQMRSTDYVGVLTFDDQYSWVVEPVKASDKKAIKAQIETIAEGGGTTIKPALWAALEGVKQCDADIRHVVLLTDGQGEDRNYRDLTASYTDGDVTLSTVAVGEGSDQRLLEQLAEECKGRYYYSDIAADIPKIFAQEVFLSGDTYLQNGEFGLAVNGSSELTRGLFETGWPEIYGYVSATPKSASSVLIASEKDDPVLTVMQYGLGHTIAWNTDVTNQWTAGFAGQEDYVQLWKRVIDYSAGNAAIGEDSVDVMTAGGYTSIVYRARDYGEDTQVEAVYTDPEGSTRTVPLQASAPGSYEARLETDMTGIYNLSVRRVDGGEITNAVTTAAAVQYSDEYKFDVSPAAFTEFVERYGALLGPEEDFWKQRKSGARERFELAKWLIFAAVLWFVMDIAFRRFCFRPQDTRLYRFVGRRWEMLCARRRNAGRGGGDERFGGVPGGSAGDSFGGVSDEGNGGQPGEVSGAGGAPYAGAAADRDAPGGEKGRRKPGKGAKGGKQEPQALDTSALLRKKDQRRQ